jgi:hypothetical protein
MCSTGATETARLARGVSDITSSSFKHGLGSRVHLAAKQQQKRPPVVIAKADLVATPILPLMSDPPCVAKSTPFFDRIWPVSGLIAAIVVNVAWMGFLRYGFLKLIRPAFF